MTLKDQKFGVEIEFTGITREKAANIVAAALDSRASEPASNCYHTRTIQDVEGRTWKVMRDSSIYARRSDTETSCMDEYKVELVTPPLNYDDISLLQGIVRQLRQAGGKANDSCGIHIHVDGANHDAQSLRRLVNFMVARQDLIYEALENETRERWCRKLSPELLKEMKKDKSHRLDRMENIWYSNANDGYYGSVFENHEHYNQTRYHGVNLHSFFTKGTVEFRLFNSTLHAGKIKAYIQFCLALSAWAINSSDRVVFRSVDGYTAEQKVTLMRDILTNRLGLTGDEFKTCRLHLMNPLKKAAGMNIRNAA